MEEKPTVAEFGYDFPADTSTTEELSAKAEGEAIAAVSLKIKAVGWHDAKIASLQQERDLLLDRINQHYDHAEDVHLKAIVFVQSVIEPWVRAYLKDKKERSISTAFGRTGLRHIAEGPDWPDDGTLLEIVKAAGLPAEAVLVEERVSKKWLKTHGGPNANKKFAVTLKDGAGQEVCVELDVPTKPAEDRFYIEAGGAK
jgi:hypothetical protein